MSLMLSVLMVVQVLAAITLIILVLLQQGKGADMGSTFGSGSAGSLFGASGAANFLSRTTKWVAVVFFAATAGLAYVGRQPAPGTSNQGGVMQNYQPQNSTGNAQPSNSVPAAQPGAVPAIPSSPDASIPAALPPTNTPAPAPSSHPAERSRPAAPVKSAPAKPQAPSSPAPLRDTQDAG